MLFERLFPSCAACSRSFDEMGRFRLVSRRLEVLLHGTPVGEISETADGGTEFRFLDDYFELVPRLVLGQTFEDDLERVHRSRDRERLPDFFANLTPEGRLRELIEQTTGVETGVPSWDRGGAAL